MQARQLGEAARQVREGAGPGEAGQFGGDSRHPTSNVLVELNRYCKHPN